MAIPDVCGCPRCGPRASRSPTDQSTAPCSTSASVSHHTPNSSVNSTSQVTMEYMLYRIFRQAHDEGDGHGVTLAHPLCDQPTQGTERRGIRMPRHRAAAHGTVHVARSVSVAVAHLEKLHALVEHFVHEAVNLVDAPRPDIPAHLLQVRRLPDPAVQVAEYHVH